MNHRAVIGNLGKDGIPLLVDLMQSAPQLELQTPQPRNSARLRGTLGDASVLPPLLPKLQHPNINWTMLTEVAWALGKIPGKRSIQPLYDLDKKLQAIYEPENMTLKKLKEAVFWAIKQCDTWDQYS